MTLKFKRIGDGEYQSTCERVIIKKQVSQQTRRPDETTWEFSVDGHWHHFGYDTKRDAVLAAERKLRENDTKKAAEKLSEQYLLLTSSERTVLLAILNGAKNAKPFDPPCETVESIIAKIEKIKV